ncbi:MAG: ferritin family protein [candidate division KSB1 bacterium]|nr:ferritin family protein [candidate division KSB1 bacterium]MDZ7376932.1 ferritin family protein [candidate division KSB1 bacterium]MDZ7401612.1 ferritin family protein [candidate division KSB1 bacterium]
MSNQTTAVKALKTAIEIEDQGLLNFLKFARQTKDTTGKNMFIRLAMDEHEHRRIIEKQLANLMEGKPLLKIEIPKSEIEQVAPTIREKQQKTRGESGLLEIDALNTALDLERKAAKFFRDQANLVDDPEAKSMFIRLAEWEDAHFDIIQAELDSIQGTGFWFGIPEFQMDGKF